MGHKHIENLVQERPAAFKDLLCGSPFNLTRSCYSNIASLFAAHEWLAVRKE